MSNSVIQIVLPNLRTKGKRGRETMSGQEWQVPSWQQASKATRRDEKRPFPHDSRAKSNFFFFFFFFYTTVARVTFDPSRSTKIARKTRFGKTTPENEVYL